jgi:hypothetical protein
LCRSGGTTPLTNTLSHTALLALPHSPHHVGMYTQASTASKVVIKTEPIPPLKAIVEGGFQVNLHRLPGYGGDRFGRGVGQVRSTASLAHGGGKNAANRRAAPTQSPPAVCTAELCPTRWNDTVATPACARTPPPPPFRIQCTVSHPADASQGWRATQHWCHRSSERSSASVNLLMQGRDTTQALCREHRY